MANQHSENNSQSEQSIRAAPEINIGGLQYQTVCNLQTAQGVLYSDNQ
jgi:hypothetical protein